ncbi:hypothetical protein GC194_04990 [bacterium]|nr:hypothetical protein [bacterium]
MRKLVHAYRTVYGDLDGFSIENFANTIKALKRCKGDAELYNLEWQSDQFEINDSEFRRLCLLIEKEINLIRNVTSEHDLIISFIEATERNSQLGFDPTKVKEAYYYLRRNNFKIPGMRDIEPETPINSPVG